MSSFQFQNTIFKGNFVIHMSYPQTIIPIQANLAGVHGRSHVPSQSFSKAAVLIAVKVLGMLQHTNPLSLNYKLILRDFYLV